MEAAAAVVSIIIPTFNRQDKLNRCLTSVCKSDYPHTDVIVIDDASEYDAAAVLRERFPSVRVFRNDQRRLLSFSRNLGAHHSKGDYLFFLDDDNVVATDAISELVKIFQEVDMVGVVAPISFRYDDPSKVWTSFIRRGRFPGFYVLGLIVPDRVEDTFSFHNAFMVKRTIFEQCSRFDSDSFPIHFSELDFAYRLRKKGYRAVVNPKARVWHDVSRGHMNVDSHRSFYTLRNRIILLRRYSSGKELRTYTLAILPILILYYLRHHVMYATDNPLTAAFNLLRGVIAGLSFRDIGKWAHTLESSRMTPTLTIPKVSKTLFAGFPLVSVIVPTKNSKDTIARCLESLFRQTYPKLEILIIDNYSNDGTGVIAKTFSGVRVFQAGPERSAQVNFGVRLAHGDYIYRVDGDFVVEPGVIEEAVMTCKQNGFHIVTIHNTSDPTISFWSRVRKLERDCYQDDTVNIAARFFDRKAFLAAGGFDEALIASEDYDLHNRLARSGFEIGRIRSKELHIGEPKRLKEVVQKHIFYGKKIEDFVVRNPGALTRQLSPIRMAYVRHWRDFLKNPKLTMGFILYQFVRYSAAVAGYLSNKL